MFLEPLVRFANALIPSPVLNPVVDAVRKVCPAKVASVEVEVVAAKPKLPKRLVVLSWLVEEDCMPAWNQIGVEVELAVAPKFEVVVKGKDACEGVA